VLVARRSSGCTGAQHHETPPEQLRDGGRQWLDDSGKRGKVTLTAILKKEKNASTFIF